MFLTLLYIVTDPGRKKIFFSNAGHEPLIFSRASRGKTEILSGARATPLGVFEQSYETGETPFETGDAFLIISDGVRELRSARREEFGIERLAKFFGECAARSPAKEIIERLFQQMASWSGGLPAHDDRTLVCVKAL